MIQQLKHKPLFVLLLPVFFVIHGYAEHFGAIGFSDIAYLLGVYCIITTLICLLFRFIFSNDNKSALMTSALMAIYFFYGALFDFLKTNAPVNGLHRYSILLPLLGIALLIFFIFLKKTNRLFSRLVLFLNILLLIYLGVDLITVGWKAMDLNNNKLNHYNLARNKNWQIPDSCQKPDIYFFIFDEYASSRSLKEKFHFTNDLDSFLLSRQFHLQNNSTSNYNSTPFSMASMLNMKYLEGINSSGKVGREDYLDCNLFIKENAVTQFLDINGYTIINLSIFDLAGNPSGFQQSFLPLKTKIITEGTLFARIYRDFEWFFFANKTLATLFNKPAHPYLEHKDNNETIFREVIKQSAIKSERPRFIYAHFFMPHYPFFYDRFGKPRADSIILREAKGVHPVSYIDYIPYVNSRIRQLVDTLQQNTHSSAAVILLGDHGFRDERDSSINVFRNLNATYFPGGNYTKFYDSMSTVNYFRATFNTLFNQQFPLLKDSTIYLRGK